jgi:NAD(P)-dependent dehydrogenase (short-subunit alcohol dehydrogenase family)
MVDSLTGKVVIVTGGAGAIGSVTSTMFARRGAKVVVADLNGTAAERAAAQIAASGGSAIAVQFDLCRDESIKALFDETIRAFGKLDVLFNNAADLAPEVYPLDRDIETMNPDVWDRTYRANVRGTMLCCKFALQIMPRHAGASIINAGSDLALGGSLVQAAYSSSKAAIIQMTRSIATSHARQGIRCNTVSPGLTLTEHSRAVIPAPIRQMVEDETLTPELGAPEDIANMVLFLASDEAKHITGQNFLVDGGMAAHISGFGKMREVMQPSAR